MIEYSYIVKQVEVLYSLMWLRVQREQPGPSGLPPGNEERRRRDEHSRERSERQ